MNEGKIENRINRRINQSKNQESINNRMFRDTRIQSNESNQSESVLGLGHRSLPSTCVFVREQVAVFLKNARKCTL